MTTGDPRSGAPITAALRRCDRVVVAWLFGSAATGHRRRDSDVDVAVIFTPGLSDRDRFRLRCTLSEEVARAARVDRADVIDFESASPLLAHEVVRVGRLLFSRDERRRVGAVARQAMRYIDTKPLRRLLDDAVFRRLGEGNFGRLA